jgi:hypothetical protein
MSSDHQHLHYHPGVAADNYAKKELEKYFDYNLTSNNLNSLVIFAVETNGSFGSDAIKFCRSLAKMSYHPDGSQNHNMLSYIFQQLSVAIQVSKANQVLFAMREYSAPLEEQPSSQSINRSQFSGQPSWGTSAHLTESSSQSNTRSQSSRQLSRGTPRRVNRAE